MAPRQCENKAKHCTAKWQAAVSQLNAPLAGHPTSFLALPIGSIMCFLPIAAPKLFCNSADVMLNFVSMGCFRLSLETETAAMEAQSVNFAPRASQATAKQLMYPTCTLISDRELVKSFIFQAKIPEFTNRELPCPPRFGLSCFTGRTKTSLCTRVPFRDLKL